MDIIHKLQAVKEFAFVFQSPKHRTLIGDATPEQLSAAAKRLSEIATAAKDRQAKSLESYGMPEDLTRAVRLAMAEVFGEFVSADEIDDFSAAKVWELLETFHDWKASRGHTATQDEPAAEPTTPEPKPIVRTFKEWQKMLAWSATTWNRRRKDFPDSFTDVPGENACSVREPELSMWLASAQNKLSPFKNHK